MHNTYSFFSHHCRRLVSLLWWNLHKFYVVGVTIDLEWVKFKIDDGKFNLIENETPMKTICQFILCLKFSLFFSFRCSFSFYTQKVLWLVHVNVFFLCTVKQYTWQWKTDDGQDSEYIKLVQYHRYNRYNWISIKRGKWSDWEKKRNETKRKENKVEYTWNGIPFN